MNRHPKPRSSRTTTGLVLLIAAMLAFVAPRETMANEAASRATDVRFAFRHSAGIENEAEAHRAALAKAAAWFQDEIGWEGAFSFAVLNREDFAAASFTPYPTPHTQRSERLIVIPDSIASYPGFETWGLDATNLNTALSIHELGHIIAGDLGLATPNGWFNELLANLFLAAYVDSGHRELATLTLGIVPGSPADAARYRTLVDLDDLYSGVGAANYAWYQFRLGALADFIMADRRLADVLAALKRDFPEGADDRHPDTPEALARLERIKPGVIAFAGELAGPKRAE